MHKLFHIDQYRLPACVPNKKRGIFLVRLVDHVDCTHSSAGHEGVAPGDSGRAFDGAEAGQEGYGGSYRPYGEGCAEWQTARA